jgi:predicted metal-dependent phosphoesterase TrpH
MLREYRADLHIHTCLSPCASLDLSPRKIVERAREERLDIIAVTDHNSAKNVRVVTELGEGLRLKVIAGMEVQTREEIHLLTLFPEWRSMVPWEEEVSRHLPDVKNDPEVFGDQPVVDGEGNILGFEDRLLINSLDLSLEEVKRRVEGRGGLVIPSHFNKGSFSLISQLGMLPPDLHLEALEMTRRTELGNWGLPVHPSPSVPRIISSDSHFLEDIGSAYTVYLLAEPSLEELRLAFGGREGRRIVERVDRGVTVL